MSASTWIARAKHQLEFGRVSGANAPRQWIGIDFSGEAAPARAQRLLPLLVLALIAALGVSALRIDLIRVRYAMASALVEEEALISEQRRLIVRRRQLRDPFKLAVEARARGFRPAGPVLTLPEPIHGGSGFVARRSSLPVVAAALPSMNTENDWQ